MPKPASVPPAWASTANYPASDYPDFFPWPDELGAPGREPHPQAGNPTSWGGTARRIVTGLTAFANAGITPGAPLQGQLLNEWLAQMQDWTAWVDEGSSANGLTAHLVETTADGYASIARGVFGGSAASAFALTVTENSGATGVSAEVTNSSGGFALTAISTGALAAFRSTASGSGSIAVEGLCTGSPLGTGVRGTGAGAGAGVVGAGGSAGLGGDFLGGATSGDGAQGTTVTNGGVGLVGNSSSTASHTGWGVVGNASVNTGGGVRGAQLNVGADPTDSSQAGVFGLSSDGTGVFGSAVAGYGGWFEADATTPTRAALHLEPQDTDPSSPLEGDIFPHSGQTHLKARIDSRWQGLWATEKGHAYGFIIDDSQTDHTGNTNYQTIATVTVNAPFEVKQSGGILTLAVQFEMGMSIAATEFEWRLEDATAGGVYPIAARLETAHIASASLADEKYVVAKVSYSVPAAGNRSFELQVRTTNGSNVFRIRKVSIEASGTH